MVEYTVAICNYNEVASLEPSLQSVLAQIDDRYEVLVVDDGSTDGSVEVLERMLEEHDRLRVVALPPDPSRKLGKTRTISLDKATGDHVLLHIDTDNYYTDGILDVVEVYEQLRAGIGEEFYLLGASFAVTSREFLLEEFGGYRNLPVGGEDRDLWRRLAAAGKLVCLKHGRIERLENWEHGSKYRDLQGRLQRTMEVKIANFQVGISLRSYLRWALEKHPFLVLFHFGTIPFAYLLAFTRESYETPPAFQEKEDIDEELAACTRPLNALEAVHDITVDRERLSAAGRDLFDGE